MKVLELTDNEIKALRLCVIGDVKIFMDRRSHAVSHGDNYHDPYGECLEGVLDKLDDL